MCTLSVVLAPDGFLVAMNRDERRDRPLGGTLWTGELGGHAVAHPTDLEAGGTWFGASGAGYLAAVLNNYQAADQSPRPLSRGEIPLALLAEGEVSGAARVLERLDIRLYRPFRAVLIAPGLGVWVGESDGQALTLTRHPWGSRLLVSSGREEPLVRAHREVLFSTLLADLPTLSDPLEALRALHFRQEPGATHLGFSMERPEARSVSYSELDARGGRLILRHLEAPPIGYDDGRRATLDRSAVALSR